MLALPSAIATTVAVPLCTPQSISTPHASALFVGAGIPTFSREKCKACSRNPRYGFLAEDCADTERRENQPSARTIPITSKTRRTTKNPRVFTAAPYMRLTSGVSDICHTAGTGLGVPHLAAFPSLPLRSYTKEFRLTSLYRSMPARPPGKLGIPPGLGMGTLTPHEA
jgi:hypothetical protein